MPVDNTRVISPRRTQKKLTEEELKDIDRKRLLGELSCAECRRLKLRCDKKLPCGSCFRRGCESICPLGILAAGQGTRFILADTEQLHEKIYEMSNRIRQLEDGLAILQSTVSDQRHPLLTDELLKIKFGSEAINARQHTSDEESTAAKSIDALGTLTLGSSGEMQYFGRSAGSERAGEEADGSSEEDNDETNSPHDIFLEVEKLANLFPFANKGRPTNQGLELIETFLPTFDLASKLCDSYIQHGSYFFRPIKADDLLNGLFPSVYNRILARTQTVPQPQPADKEYDSPHALATLCFVFALGCLLDLTRMPYNSEAERYYDLGRAALSLRPVYDSPNMDSVQAMGLMATYHSLAGKKYSRDSAWCVMSFAAKLAQSVRLVYRDSARWNMDPKTVQKRRNLFWEVFSADVSHSLALGRPPAIHLSYVDCEFPLDDDASLSTDAEHQNGFWRMKHTFAKDIYNSVADATLIAHSPSYNTILDLDRKVREISFPATFNPYVTKEVGPQIFHSSSLSLRDFYASQHRTVTMIYLHRSFFAQAMLDHPTNPLLSPFAPSFLTAYRSASVIIKASAHLFERCAAMAMRLWFLMYHTFSAAVIVGTVVTRSPNSNIASIAMRDFNLALSLFERTAAQSQRAKIALGVLLKLRDKAKRAYEQFSALSNTGAGSEATSNQADDIEDDLAIFGGQMRVLDRKGKHGLGHGHRRSPSSATGSGGSASTDSPQASSASVSPTTHPAVLSLGFGLELPDVHPSLVAYLNQDAVRRAMQGQGQGTARSGGGGGGGRSQQAAPVSILIPEAEGPGSRARSSGGAGSGQEYHRQAQASGGAGNSNQPSQMNTYTDGGSSSDEVSGTGRGSLGSFNFASGPASQQSRDWTAFGHDAFGEAAQQQSSPLGLGFSSQAGGVIGGRPTLPGIASLPTSSMAQGFGMQGGYLSNSGAFASSHQAGQYQDRSGTGEFAGYNYPALGNQGQGQGQGQGGNYEMGGGQQSQSQSQLGWAGDGDGGNSGLDMNPMDPAGAVEMGLSSESGMDAGWMSFMRDCGIMDVEG
ncbi:hypothetical protein GALMADRAFT_222679 [Galerina marginata CBS 339.88]|uniref:Zn(2)-C6 fungal-type domain-containing protein n=1 Tax=Galerina marginata (strain CBS 339.88) TaxID=685588 RepID=A0A067TFM6_GALM3|nr:hypothetical protein GALMADRAFT_222679 [Galerina marginata CBS 339.88]